MNVRFPSKTSENGAIGERCPASCRTGGFSIIELLVATTIVIVILIVVFETTRQFANVWKSTNIKIEAFQGARVAFESITQNLGQATLNTYYDYYDQNGLRRTSATADTFEPKYYGRYSDLHFVSGKSLLNNQVGHAVFFQILAGYSDEAHYQNMDTLLNAFGYYIEYKSDPNVPAFLSVLPNKPSDRYRFRLMQFMQSSQNLSVYTKTNDRTWFTDALSLASPPVWPITDNIVLLVINPKDPQGTHLTNDFEYDTRKDAATINLQKPYTHQLPPLVEIIMVAIDESSAKRLCDSTAPDLGISTLFNNPSKIDDDLATLGTTLTNRHIIYRVFRTTVALRNAKWSS